MERSSNEISMTEATADGEDSVFLDLRSNIEQLKVASKPLEDEIVALDRQRINLSQSSGFEAVCAWDKKVGFGQRIDALRAIDSRVDRSAEQMIELGPKTLVAIAVTAATLKHEYLSDYWKQPEDDRDWDVELLGRLALSPRTANEHDHLPGVASAV